MTMRFNKLSKRLDREKSERQDREVGRSHTQDLRSDPSPMKIVTVISSTFATCLLISGCEDLIQNNEADTRTCPSLRIGARPPYGSPIWHPSGEFIGFNHRPLVEIQITLDGPCTTDVRFVFDYDTSAFWLMDPSGVNMRGIYESTFSDPDWSPDGNWLAFDIYGNIYKMQFIKGSFVTSSLQQLTFGEWFFEPSWSPDGKKIAYSKTFGDSVGIWILSADGTGTKEYFGFFGAHDWLPDGKNLAYQNREGIWIESLDHSSKTQIYSDTTLWFGSLEVSPSGSSFALSMAKGGTADFNLWLIDSDGTDLRQLTTDGILENISWSPDGKWIAYVDGRPTDFSYDNGTIWVVNVETGHHRQLTFN